jgi:hypothetical protein
MGRRLKRGIPFTFWLKSLTRKCGAKAMKQHQTILRLFEVKGNDLKGEYFFASKVIAKEFRDEQPGRHVTFGPDHRMYGAKGHPTTDHNKMVRRKKK